VGLFSFRILKVIWIPDLFFYLIKYYFSVDAVVWLMEHMEEVDTEMKAIQVNRREFSYLDFEYCV
jgi:hypothetical protein